MWRGDGKEILYVREEAVSVIVSRSAGGGVTLGGERLFGGLRPASAYLNRSETPSGVCARSRA